MKIFFICWCCICCFELRMQAQDAALLPYPNRIEILTGEKGFVFSPETSVYVNSSDLEIPVKALQKILNARMGVSLTKTEKREKRQVRLVIDSCLEGKEHYRLHIDRNLLEIRGATAAAVFYGVMTLDQLLLGDGGCAVKKEVGALKIDDAPRFAYRALMLDPARHFLPVEDVKFFIDQMARYKYNVLQMHLTDDQGWRIEIKKYPELTKVGASGLQPGFYTQEQLKELVRYAAERYIEVVPELDIPGHTVALLAAHPELGCTGTDSIQKVVGKTTNLMLCAAKEQVYNMYADIIREVAALFPSKKIHLGGDEAVIEQNWGRCKDCRALMNTLGYTQASQLMNEFFGRILKEVRKYGKQAILWCELDRIYPPAHNYLFDYPKDVILTSWRYGLSPKCMELTRQHGHQIIMAPGEYAYLDYPQLKGDFPEFNNWGMPVTTLEQTYRFDPGYGLPQKEQAHVYGVMGTLWGEAIKDINRATYMAYPRAFALAEAGWTEMSMRSWESFKKRLYPNLMNLMKCGVSVRAPFEIAK